MRNPGIQFKVTKGIRKGLFGIAYHREQRQEFDDKGKVFAHFYCDPLCQLKPVGINDIGLIAVEYIKQVGYVD